MIRKNIIKNKNDKQRYFLNDSWRIEMPAVVRTPFYGNNCSEYFGYVVTYSEMEQAYHLLKVDLHNGKILWSIDAVNGGYGTPTVFGDLVVFLKEFDAVQAVSAESGIVEWAVQGGHRVRTTLNVIDETLWFGSGSTLLAVNKNGEVVKKLHIPNSFIYGNITPYKGGILCTGTLHNNERDCSCSYLWLINQEGSIMYSMELGRSPVISSDTSGIWLHQYLKVSTEENIFSSGAALVQGLMKVHGKSISQKDFRDRINYVKRKSNWKDADFQTWRLILKRVLSNSAESLDDFIRSEEGGEFEIF